MCAEEGETAFTRDKVSLSACSGSLLRAGLRGTSGGHGVTRIPSP